jgi:hypothetical protein
MTASWLPPAAHHTRIYSNGFSSMRVTEYVRIYNHVFPNRLIKERRSLSRVASGCVLID